MNDIMKLDLYSLLEISNESTEQEIKRSYRKRALTCHPDKNPDNPKAAELFHQLSKALEILTDVTAKSAYDRLLRARKASAFRDRHLDSKRKKFKDELEAREKAAKEEVITEAEATAKLSKEIERLRKEGSKQLEKENELLKKEIEEEMKLKVEMKLNESNCLPRLKVKKKYKSVDFSDNFLRQYFIRFGDISCLVIAKNNKRAIIEFTRYESALNAFECEHQLFSIEWIESIPQTTQTEPQINLNIINSEMSESNKIMFENHQNFDSNYESLVLRNLRLAEERKKLIKQMEDQECNDN